MLLHYLPYQSTTTFIHHWQLTTSVPRYWIDKTFASALREDSFYDKEKQRPMIFFYQVYICSITIVKIDGSDGLLGKKFSMSNVKSIEKKSTWQQREKLKEIFKRIRMLVAYVHQHRSVIGQ